MRFPKPFFRTSKTAWYLQVGKRQVSLGPDRTEAFTLYREVYIPQLGGTIERRRDFKTIVLCDLFLDLHKEKLKSWDWYRHFLIAFTDQCGHMRVIDLRPFHLNGWLAKTKWTDTTKNKVIGIVKRVFNWAAKEHYIIHCRFGQESSRSQQSAHRSRSRGDCHVDLSALRLNPNVRKDCPAGMRLNNHLHFASNIV